MESGQNNIRELLSIVIPTYNRRNKLKNTLELIFKQDLTQVERVIVVDNNSNYDIFELGSIISNDKLFIHRNPFNIGMVANIINSFMYCESKWMWLLSDDDEIETDAINTIIHEIYLNQNVAALKYVDVLNEKVGIIENKRCNSLEDFIDYYLSYGDLGELIFMSNNIYNIEKLKPYFEMGFTHANTYIPHLLTLLVALNHGETVLIINQKIVTYKLPEKDAHWIFSDIYLGISTISHIPFNLTRKYKKRLFSMFNQLDYMTIYTQIIKEEYSDFRLLQFKLIYHNHKKYYLRFEDRILMKFLLNKHLTYFLKNNPRFFEIINTFRQSFIRLTHKFQIKYNN